MASTLGLEEWLALLEEKVEKPTPIEERLAKVGSKAVAGIPATRSSPLRHRASS
jgi:hypothetical protein